MIRSMTGFGRGEYTEGGRKITVEIRSVNNRYLDLSVKMPRNLWPFESAIRSAVKQRIQRGKLDLSVSVENTEVSGTSIHYNPEVAETYICYMREMAETFGLSADPDPAVIARFPEVFTSAETETDEETLGEEIARALDQAIDRLIAAREKEGAFLREDLLGKLEELSGHVDFIEARSPELVRQYRERIYAKVTELLGDKSIDDGRMLQEVTLYADKICVDEEMVRLRSHVQAMQSALSGADGVGRRLDFLAQEMNREANTTLSKTDDVEISDRGIELKTLIEKIREQIQNIE